MIIDIQEEKDGTFTAFLRGAEYAWTGEKTKEEALKGLENLYPEIKKDLNAIRPNINSRFHSKQ